ncbi:unnamed protein product [Symbiodinium sp. CCMP2456]|nr:unnamed protein product [Symbiodinium sp. CCMP2456]
MGNYCVSRDDDPQQSRRQYESYTFLRHQIVEKLSNDVLATECRHLYEEDTLNWALTAFMQCRLVFITVSGLLEVCLPFIVRVSCNDPQTQQRILQSVDELYPGPPQRSVTQATFIEFNRLALSLAEQDLRRRIAKLKDKFGGNAPPAVLVSQSSQLDWVGELLGKDQACSSRPSHLRPQGY